MRHRRAGWKVGRNTEHRRALLRNLVTSLIVEERIETTLTKAKAMRPHVERMITLGKRGDLSARRQAAAYLMTRESVDKLFDTISPRYGPSTRSARSALKPAPSARKKTARPWKQPTLRLTPRLPRLRNLNPSQKKSKLDVAVANFKSALRSRCVFLFV